MSLRCSKEVELGIGPDPLRIVNDCALTEGRAPKRDELGFEHYAVALSRVITDNDEPLTIGVYGKWGTGKTSLLRLIEQQLGNRTNVMTVWFNAWRYGHEAHPLIPLIERILTEFRGTKGRAFSEKLAQQGQTVVDILESVLSSLTISVGVPSNSPISASVSVDGNKLVRAWKKIRSRGVLPSTLYLDAFRRLDAIALPKHKRIVVLVDDLDRCLPENAIRLLESIKLALSLPGFAFVLAVSPKIVLQYLQHKYQDEFGITEFDSRNYLEKIVQIPFYLPDHTERMRSFCQSLLTAVPQEQRRHFGTILPMIARCCRGVPRLAISFFNSILIARAIYQDMTGRNPGANEEVPLVAFAVDRILQLVWRDTYDLLVTSPLLCENAAKWDEQTVEDVQNWDSRWTFVLERLTSDPNLRDFVLGEACKEWLARLYRPHFANAHLGR